MEQRYQQDGARDRNAALRRAYLELDAAAAAADTAGEPDTVRRLRLKQEQVAHDFVVANTPYARSLARKWSRVNTGNADDYLAAALERLWWAFLQWDPEKGSFTTFSRAHINGAVQREVSRQEYDGRSYGDFTARSRVNDVKDQLARQLGRTPTSDEIGRATGLPVDEVEMLGTVYDRLGVDGVAVTVERLSAAADVSGNVAGRYLASRKRLTDLNGRAPTAAEISADTGMSVGLIERASQAGAVSLDAPAGPEGDDTIGDHIADPSDPNGWLEDDREWEAYLKEVTSKLNGQQLWAVLRVNGLDSAWPQTMREIAAQTDVGRETIRRSERNAQRLLSGPLPSLIQ